MHRYRRIGSMALAALALPGWALAHHSYAAYDRTRQLDIQGTVATWEWTNPHVHMVVLAPPAPGAAPKPWDLEGSSPGTLRSRGWERDVLKVGDKVKVKLYPRKDGVLGGDFITATLANGRVIGAGNTEP